MTYVFFKNTYFSNDYISYSQDINVQDFSIQSVDFDKYNIVIQYKKSTKFTILYSNFINIQHSDFIENNDFNVYLLFDKDKLIYIDKIKKSVTHHYVLSNNFFSHQYINKKVHQKKNNNLMVVYFGSMKNYKNFTMFNDRLQRTLKSKFDGTYQTMHIIQKDSHSDLLYKIDSDVKILIENIDHYDFYYVAYLFYVFYKNMKKNEISRVIFINLNHSILGISNIESMDVYSFENYYCEDLFYFGILNEKDFYKIGTVYPSFIYQDNMEFMDYIKSVIENIYFIKVNDMSIIKLS